MRASHSVRPIFDDPNLVSAAGLVPVLRLAETAGLHDLLNQYLSVDSPAATVKTACVVAGVLAGRTASTTWTCSATAGWTRCFAGSGRPSPLGTHLRQFTHGHVQQLDAVTSRLIAGLATRCHGLIADSGLVLVDVDNTIGQVHGYAKRAAAYGYSGVKGLNLQLATISTPVSAPVIAQARLRAGNTASAAGAARLVAQAVTTVRRADVTGQIPARADSAYYGWAFVGAALKADAWFSVTARMTPTVTARSPGSPKRRGSRSAARTRSTTKTRTATSPTPRSPKPPSPVADLDADDEANER